VIAYSLSSSQHSSHVVLVFFLFRFIPATQLILIFIFLKKPVGNWDLIADMTHLFFSDVMLLRLMFNIGLFARIGLSLLLSMAVYGSRHVDLERKTLAFTPRIRQLHHVSLREWLTINLHRVL